MTSSLTILQLLPSLETGGAERTAIDISRALVEAGHRSIVASSGGRLIDELLATGAEHVILPLASKNPLTMAGNARRLVRLVGAEKVDVVHARSRAPAWSAWLACRRTGTPWVTTYHGIYSENGALKRLYNSVMARSDMVIANSNYTADLIASRYGTERERIRVIYRGMDLDGFRREAVGTDRKTALRRQWEVAEGRRVILNVARLTGWKGQQVLIDAACRPPLGERDDLVFVLAGDEQGRTGYRRQLQEKVDAAGAGARIRIVGHCSDVAAALALADVSVVASTLPEAFGRAAVESQALGVPTVATWIGAAPETVLAPPAVEAGERTGWLVPPDDADALGRAIDEALALDGSQRQALAARARRQAEKFSMDAMCGQTLSLYRDLVRS